MNSVRIEVNESTLRELVVAHLQRNLGMDFGLSKEDVKIQVKSRQNYKAEWESADFRAVVDKTF